MKRFVTILLSLFLASTALAQAELDLHWEEYLEQVAEESSSMAYDELVELLESLQLHPANINDSAQMSRLSFLDEILIRRILLYRQEYGDLLSLEELHLINGFDSTSIAMLRPLVTVLPSTNRRLSLREALRYGYSSFLMGGSQTLEPSRAYNENIYEGSPQRLYFKYSFNYQDRILFQFSGEKDPGEAFFKGTNPQGFDFYSGHLMLNGLGRMEKLIVGQYRLQFGQGVTLWTGYAPTSAIDASAAFSAQGIRPASAFTEYNYLQGVANTINLGKGFHLTSFYSYTHRDSVASPTGYHRYPTETKKEDLRTEQLCGVNLQYHSPDLTIGTTLQYIDYDKPFEPKPNQYNQYYFRGYSNWNIGIDASYLYKRILFFGEIAMSKNGALAGIGGFQIPFDSKTRLCAYYRNYDKAYQSQYSATLGQNTATHNEEGFCLAINHNMKHQITLKATADFFRFPWNKYQVYGPSHGSDLRLRLEKDWGNTFQLHASYRHKSSGRNGDKDSSNTYSLEQIHRHQFQTNFAYTIGNFRWVTRVAYNRFHCEQHESYDGWALAQDLQYSGQHLTLIGRLSRFDVDDYDSRIYLYENDLTYEYGSSDLMYKGIRGFLVLRLRLTEQLRLSLKYSIARYDDKETISSGYDLISQNHRQIIKAQLLWKF